VIVSLVVSVSPSRASARYARPETVRRDNETVAQRDDRLSTSTSASARLHGSADIGPLDVDIDERTVPSPLCTVHAHAESGPNARRRAHARAS
jgi:hypothetical protein